MPKLDVVRVQDVGLIETPDPTILAWAAAEGRILLTHDRDTVPGFAYDRVRGHPGTSMIALPHPASPGGRGELLAERLFGRGHLAARLQGEDSIAYAQVPMLLPEQIATIVEAIRKSASK